MTYFDFELTHCPVELSIDLINRKWVLQIICDMFFGKTRFSEFQEERPKLSNKALSRSLRFMEEQDLIEKVEDEYFLTEKGKSLIEPPHLIEDWGFLNFFHLIMVNLSIFSGYLR